ncbi:hypothetical protein LZ31DRAFT_29971 [Colletotrichum somersetense]|nr:hypothetical protein LZ31DRAFT_29971 [Colletotrichum somersetense]
MRGSIQEPRRVTRRRDLATPQLCPRTVMHGVIGSSLDKSPDTTRHHPRCHSRDSGNAAPSHEQCAAWTMIITSLPASFARPTSSPHVGRRACKAHHGRRRLEVSETRIRRQQPKPPCPGSKE